MCYLDGICPPEVRASSTWSWVRKRPKAPKRREKVPLCELLQLTDPAEKPPAGFILCFPLWGVAEQRRRRWGGLCDRRVPRTRGLGPAEVCGAFPSKRAPLARWRRGERLKKGVEVINCIFGTQMTSPSGLSPAPLLPVWGQPEPFLFGAGVRLMLLRGVSRKKRRLLHQETPEWRERF